MRSAHLLAYRLTARVVHRSARLRGKLSRSVRGRRDAAADWERWAARQRTDAPLVWVHGASVGEALTALPVVTRLRAALTDLQVAHTYSSSSASHWPGGFADHAGYVPLDEPQPVRHVLNAVRPALLVFARGDVWPELVIQAEARDVPIVVLGAAVRADSKRLIRPLRSLYREVYRAVGWLGAISNDHAARWQMLGVPDRAVQLTGDPRHDQILEHVPALHKLHGLENWSTPGMTLVAGSTDAHDEAVVLEAFRHVLQVHTDARLVVVPHEPTTSRIRAVVSCAERLELAASVWNGSDPVNESQCVVVSGLGALLDLYALGSTAYVGGGFSSGGLHATAEPAAYALPVIVGPHFAWSDDGRAIVESGGGIALPHTDASRTLQRAWLEWIGDPEARISHGLAARKTLQQGAASATARALLSMI